MRSERARELFAAERVARLATADRNGQPHIVSMVFAVEGDRIYSAVDSKPKRTTALKRLANIEANPRVALLADAYADEWTTLWWVRADGVGRVVDPTDSAAAHAVDVLAGKYTQYRQIRPTGPVIVIDVERWSGWSASRIHDEPTG